MADSKLRTLRVPDDGRWERASERAAAAGTSVSAVLNQALLDYAPAPVTEGSTAAA